MEHRTTDRPDAAGPHRPQPHERRLAPGPVAGERCDVVIVGGIEAAAAGATLRRVLPGCRIETAATREEIGSALARDPDAVVCDVQAAGLGLQGLAGLVHARRPAPPLVVVADRLTPSLVTQAVEAGATRVIPSEELDDLGHTVVRALSERSVAADPHRLLQRLERIAAVAPDILFAFELEPDLDYHYVSPAVSEILGWTPGELAASPWLARQIVSFDAAEGGLDVTPGGPRARIVAARHRDGTTVWIDVHYQVEHDGERLLMIGTARDVTGLRAMHEQLVQVQKMEAVGRLASGLAHDLNNLLTVIIGFSALASEMDPPAGVARALAQIDEAGARGQLMVNRLLSLSRHRAKELAAVEANDLARSVEAMLQPLLGRRHTVELHLSPEDTTVHVDRHELEQVLVNLVVNARDAMPAGGPIEVETTVGPGPGGGPTVTITVRDRGAGMDADTLRQATEPFFTTKGEERGTGLGLSMAVSTVEEHGGRLELDSTPGEGTEVTIELPAHSPPPAPA